MLSTIFAGRQSQAATAAMEAFLVPKSLLGLYPA